MADEKMIDSKDVSPVIGTQSDIEKHGYQGDHRRSSVTQRALHQMSLNAGDDESTKEGQIFSMNDVDPALDAKMRLVNQVITAQRVSVA